jgi:hypothetical protein
MNTEIKARWLEALRSGRYQQGVGRLKNTEGQMCCLGVLCDLATKEGIGRWDRDVAGLPLFGVGASVYDGVLPYAVMEWAELDSEDPDINGCGITAYNDGHGGLHEHTFAEIADLIEAAL